MINVILLKVFLNNRLGDDFFSWNIDCLLSNHIVDLSGFSDWVQLNSLVISSLNINFYVFSLNKRNNISIFNDISSRIYNGFDFFSFSDFQFSLNRFQIHNLFSLRYKFDFFFLVNYLSLYDWLVENFSFGGRVISFDDLLSVFRRKYDLWLFNNFIIGFLKIQDLLFNVIDWLNESLSENLSPGNLNRDPVFNFLVVNNRVFNDLLSVNRSSDFLLSNNRCLNNSLFDNRLRNDSLVDNWLSDYSFGDFWLINNFSGLSDGWSGV